MGRRKKIKIEEEMIQEDQTNQDLSQAFFIDKWCAKHVRKVSFCSECLHYRKCLEKTESIAPAAIEHNKLKG